MVEDNRHLDSLQDIRRMMQRSSKFISLSGLSGVSAGFWGLAGAYFAYDWIAEYYVNQNEYSGRSFQHLTWNLICLAGAVLLLSLLSAFYFTWRKARRNNLPVWDYTSRNLVINLFIPLVAGGLFILAMLQYHEWRFVAPACLVFYGLALINGSKYTVSEIRYLGFCEVVLGLIATQFIGYGLYFWAAGFGLLHIIYGFVMWTKYERNPSED